MGEPALKLIVGKSDYGKAIGQTEHVKFMLGKVDYIEYMVGLGQ